MSLPWKAFACGLCAWAAVAGAQAADKEPAPAPDAAAKPAPDAAAEPAANPAHEQALEALLEAEKLFGAAKFDEGVDLLWERAARLPAGDDADALRLMALRVLVARCVQDGAETAPVAARIEEAVRLRGPEHGDWVRLDAVRCCMLLADYDRARRICRGLLEDPGPAPAAGIPPAGRPPEREAARRDAREMEQRLELIGRPCPAFEVKALDGRPAGPALCRGRVTLLAFWATDCRPSLAELAGLRALHDEFAPKGLEILGLSADEDEDRLRAFVRERGLPWRQAFLGRAKFRELAEACRTGGVTPAFLLLDRAGTVRGVDLRGAVLRARVRAAMTEELAP